jgi:hypothetical protein
MRRALFMIVLCATFLGAGATSATAQRPGMFREIFGSFTQPAGIDCTFSIRFDVLAQHTHALVFPPDENGEFVVRFGGQLIERLTNLDNGKSIVLNESGPGESIVHPDGSITVIGYGPILLGFHPGDQPDGPQLLYFKGHFVAQESRDANGRDKLILESVTGSPPLDVCAALS